MAISVTTLGTAADTVGTGATLALSVPVGGCPAGAMIFVGIGEGSAATFAAGATIADDAGNTYTSIAGATCSGVSDFGQIFYAKNVSALTVAQNITVTKQNSGDKLYISALYATGIDTVAPLDTAVTASATPASTTSPTVTSGTPGQSGELFIAFIAQQQNTQLFTQDSGNGWAAPPDMIGYTSTNLGSAFVSIAGGNQVNAGSGTKTFNPTTSPVGARTAIFIAGFKAAGGSSATTGWLTPFSTPHFPKRVPSNLMPTEFASLTPATLPASVSGIAWYKPWEPPLFPVKVHADEQSTQFWAAQSIVLPSIPWYTAWEPPYFPKLTKVYLQKTELFTPSPATLPVKISGIAWMRAWEPPYFPKRVPAQLMPTEFYVNNVPPTIVFMPAWYKAFDQPNQVRTNANAQQFIFQTLRRVPRSSGQGYILTIG